MGGTIQLRRNDLLYPELSYKINGALFEVFRQIGGGHLEKYYQKAVAEALRKLGMPFTEQYHVKIKMNDTTIGNYFLDFLIDGKIVLELKRGKFVPARIIDQAEKYLQTLNLDLAVIACFTDNGVIPKRIINPQRVPRSTTYPF